MNDLDRALDPATSTAELAVIGQSIFRSYAFSDDASMDLWVALLGNPSLHASNMNLLLAHVRVAPKGRPGLHEEAVEAFASNPSVPFALLLGEINLAVPVALLIDDLFTMGEGGARAARLARGRGGGVVASAAQCVDGARQS